MTASASRPSLTSRLHSGRPVRGVFTGTADATLCEFVAMLGWDFLLVDAEHCSVETRDMENIARACELRSACALARVPIDAPNEVARFLDAGAEGIMVPFVESADDARHAVELIKYPPRGRRGLGAPRSADFALRAPLESEIARANRDTVVIVQIESLRGLEQAEAIVAVEGVDVAFLGPADLSLALGAACQWDAPGFMGAVQRIAAVAAQAGKVFGAYASSLDGMRWYEALGARFMAAALEDLLMLGTKEFAI